MLCHLLTTLGNTTAVYLLLPQIVGELGYENEYLRRTCAEQEDQVRPTVYNTLLHWGALELGAFVVDYKADKCADGEQITLRAVRGGQD
jgi:hypothetical protein